MEWLPSRRSVINMHYCVLFLRAFSHGDDDQVGASCGCHNVLLDLSERNSWFRDQLSRKIAIDLK